MGRGDLRKVRWRHDRRKKKKAREKPNAAATAATPTSPRRT